MIDYGIINENDGYAVKRKDLHTFFNRSYNDIYVQAYNVTIDNSEDRERQSNAKECLVESMNSAGYTDVSVYSLFEYKDYFDYFINHLYFQPLFIIEYALIFIAIVLTIVLSIIMKKELIVGDNTVTCKYGKNKSKEIFIKDIINIESSKSSLKLSGNGFKFKASRIINTDELKSAIMQKKNDLDKSHKTV